VYVPLVLAADLRSGKPLLDVTDSGVDVDHVHSIFEPGVGDVRVAGLYEPANTSTAGSIWATHGGEGAAAGRSGAAWAEGAAASSAETAKAAAGRRRSEQRVGIVSTYAQARRVSSDAVFSRPAR
jgi:hypothetical protein